METIIQRLSEICQNNNVNLHRHAACLLKGQKPLIYAGNNDRSYLHGKVCCSGHAEQMVILNYFRGRLRWGGRRWYFCDYVNKKPLKKHKLLVIRVNKQGKIMNSTPCTECIKLIRFTGLGKVSFSNEEGDIVVEKINEINTYTTKGYILVFKEKL